MQRCLSNHRWPLFTDQAFHRLGFPEADGEGDPGRGVGLSQLLADPFRSDGEYSDGISDELRFLDRDRLGMDGAFKTPSLRHVARTAPYGHAGQFATLEEVLEFYRTGMHDVDPHDLDPILGVQVRDFDVADMVAFLESLSGPVRMADDGAVPRHE